MFKIWAKILDEDRKLVKDFIYLNEGKFAIKQFDTYLADICYLMDIATPNTLVYHKNNYQKFSYVKYLPRDFVEKVDFYCFTLENGI